MGRVNIGICETCRKRIPTRHEIREGKVYICKDCPDCGLTEALISSDAAATWPRNRHVSWVGPHGKPPQGTRSDR